MAQVEIHWELPFESMSFDCESACDAEDDTHTDALCMAVAIMRGEVSGDYAETTGARFLSLVGADASMFCDGKYIADKALQYAAANGFAENLQDELSEWYSDAAFHAEYDLELADLQERYC